MSACVSVCVYGASENTARKKKVKTRLSTKRETETERGLCSRRRNPRASYIRTLHYITLHLRPPPTINDISPRLLHLISPQPTNNNRKPYVVKLSFGTSNTPDISIRAQPWKPGNLNFGTIGNSHLVLPLSPVLLPVSDSGLSKSLSPPWSSTTNLLPLVHDQRLMFPA